MSVMRLSCEWHGGKCRMAPVLRSHVFVSDSSCLASRTRPRKPKREFTKVFWAFAGSNSCRRRVVTVLSLATGNSSPTKTALYASRPATLDPHAIRNITVGLKIRTFANFRRG